jgi:hypothetical protein
MKQKKNRDYSFDITQSKARDLADYCCDYFDISPINVFFVRFMDHPEVEDPKAVGWYSSTKSNLPAYTMIEKNWSRRLVVLLHELTHHLQEEKYSTLFDSMHGYSFQLAKRRIARWANKAISKEYHWQFLIQSTASGHLVKPKPKKKGKKKWKKLSK